ncbi:TrkA family potassium uptake protein [Planomicrobium sp. CPCC 101110]|uniref:potassium channel family protein n=1 Tax=Planomicrobium sp. CPCC 101110 TaxID=2599619 RepID=UPI0011B854D2|nr:potassium channel family protein [Planomicrobium sp. CPCC 101110]TWT25966.1 potassium channel protein [Planomicrobium sp. CPCC 101110]
MFELMRKAVKINTGRLVLVTSVFYIASAFFIHYLEPEEFPTPFIGFWWVMTTVTTIGYGDYSPATVPGMLFGIFLYLFGIGLIGIIIGKIVDSYTYFRRLKMEGKLKYRGKGHFLIIGWSKSVQKTIDEILSNKEIKADVVLIDHLKEAPFAHEQFHYIRGNPTDTEVLRKANIDQAHSVSVFASENEDEVLRDGKTLLIATAIEEYAAQQGKQIYTIAEIVHEDHIRMFQYANVNEFILSGESFTHMMTKALLHHGSSLLFTQLLSHSYDEHIWQISLDPSWRTYGDAFESLKKQGATLIADGTDLSIIRRLEEPIPPDACLYILCDQATYRKLDLT